MTNPTPNEIRELARAALAWNGVVTNPPQHGELEWLRYREVTRDPAVVIALCDWLEYYTNGSDGRGGYVSASVMSPMNCRLNPAPAEAGGRP